LTNIRITGIADVNRVLREIAPREAVNLMRATTADMAKGIAADAKANAPSDGKGRIAKGIKHKRARGDKNTVKAEVVANADGKSMFWRFLEYGQGPDGVEHAYFLGALMKGQAEINQRYLKSFTDKLTSRLARKSKG
jgi:hypothetical protein